MKKLKMTERDRIDDLIREELRDLQYDGTLSDADKLKILERVEKLSEIRGKSNRKEKVVDTIFKVGGLILQAAALGVTMYEVNRKVVMYYDGLNFEKTGYVSSPHVKPLLNDIPKFPK